MNGSKWRFLCFSESCRNYEVRLSSPEQPFPETKASLPFCPEQGSGCSFPGLGLCLLFPHCCPSTSPAALLQEGHRCVREHSSASWCTALFPDTVQNILGLDSPFTALIHLGNCSAWTPWMWAGVEYTLFPSCSETPNPCRLGWKDVLLPFSGQDSLLEGWDAMSVSALWDFLDLPAEGCPAIITGDVQSFRWDMIHFGGEIMESSMLVLGPLLPQASGSGVCSALTSISVERGRADTPFSSSLQFLFHSGWW